MKKLMYILGYVVTICAGIATIIGLILQFSQHTLVLEVKKISVDKLTNLPTIKGLEAKYEYNQKEINSLWKLHYVITNIGDETIIGEGNKKNIIKDVITLKLQNNFKILEFNNLNKDLPFQLSVNENKVEISFLQWKNEEKLEIVLYVEEFGDIDIPEINVNEREIINGEVKYSTIFETLNNKESLFDKLPNQIKIPLWWMILVINGIFFILMPLTWISEIIKHRKYKGHIKNNTPNKEIYKPSTKILDLTFGVLIGMFLFGVPLLLLIKI